MKIIRVLLTDDHSIVLQGLRKLLEAEEDISVVGEATTGREALRKVDELKPDVIVMDIVMPLLNGLEATRQLSRKYPQGKILILSSYSEEDYVRQLTAAGAIGYLVKESAADELIDAVREVSKGNSYYSPQVAKCLRDQTRGGFADESQLPPHTRLTSREAEVLQLVAEGLPNKQIADELSISIKTVEKHRQQAMDKLNIHETAGLTRYAIAAGIIEPPTEALKLRESMGLN
jgi:DNA-binding NarL/FixJ family response regulator